MVKLLFSATGANAYEAGVSKGGQKMDVLFVTGGAELKQETGGKAGDKSREFNATRAWGPSTIKPPLI